MTTRRLLAALVLLPLAACAVGEEPVRLPEGTPYIRGVVTAIDTGSVRVEENAGEPSGSAKAVLRVGDGTRILWRTGEAAEMGDLRLGTRVSAWVSGPIAESYPVQATADALVIESTTLPADPKL